MRAKTFCLTTLGLALGVLLALTIAVAALDPFFVAHGLDEEDRALFTNQRYEMAGLIRNQDYTAVVMGTSLVANYRASWFTEGTGERTLKVTFPDGWPVEFGTALDLAFATHPALDTVYFGLDLNVLIRSDSERTVELPEYLYNTNPLDDTAYYLNKETYIQAAKSYLLGLRGELQSLDEAYVWDGVYEFSREQSLSVYYRRPVEAAKPSDLYLAAAEENLALITGWVEAHPETRFNIWFAPYSILYWDNRTRLGQADACLSALELAWDTLTQYDNVSLYSFLAREEIIADLDNYTDYIHCSGAVTRLEAEEMMAGCDPVTAENRHARLDELRELVENYDYDRIFEAET